MITASEAPRLRVIFAPDWRDGVPYQRLLAAGLERHGATVEFLNNYKRFLPLARLMHSRGACDVLHLHWPEAFYPRKGDAFDLFRTARFPLDLHLATRKCALAATAHNLHAHNRADEPFAARNTAAVHQRSDATFVHSEPAKQVLIQRFGVSEEQLHVIPHGDLSVVHGAPLSQDAARALLNLPEGSAGRKIVLIFGAVEPYKGQEAVIEWWQHHQPDALLAIVGKPITPTYGESLKARITGAGSVICEFGWLPDERLATWLSAANVALFNYREIFTSGAAPLARSWGLPVLMPTRLNTVVLDEPSRFVFRFDALDDTFVAPLNAALGTAPDYAAAAPWRAECAWDRVAALTHAAYRAAIARRSRLTSATLRPPE